MDLDAYIEQRIDILSRVRKILIENLGVRREPEHIDPDTPLFGSGLGLDSVDAVELLICMEVEFGVRLPDEQVGRADLRTVGTLVDMVLNEETGEGDVQ
jgi:acyl carrier protein